MNSNAPVIVFGEGSSAIFLLSELIERNENVFWVDGAGATLLPVQPQVKSELALGILAKNARNLGFQTGGSIEKGLCHRVYRSKAFKPSNWKKMEAETWAPELFFLGADECRVEDLNPALIQESLRERLLTHPLVTRIENTPVIEFEIFPTGGKIQFAGGAMTEFRQLYFCDDFAALKAFPKLSTIFKNQMKNIRPASRFGAIQVVFHHSAPIRQVLNRGLVIPMNRDSGETFDRDVLGYFVEPTRSVWTVFLEPSECEENHEIMKKLRKLKQSLNRAFEGPEFLPEGKKDFLSTIEKEVVRFEESFLYTEGELRTSASNPDFVLLTDSLGYSKGLERIALHFGVQPLVFDSAVEAPVMADLDSIELPEHLNLSDENPESQPSI
ncbi:MAG: hypothetical protein EBX52_04525 [Proteobacteria bacterium]|nr:hypothetical protein [Pseudomonadota bacterium]